MITRPYMRTGNARLLPIDRYDPSLVGYWPLWYSHSDMTGSTIYSYDKNRHSSAVTGAVWGITGRTFDGTDDVINCGSAASLDALTGNITVEAWINPTTLGEGSTGYIFDKVNLYMYMTATAKCVFKIKVATVLKEARAADNSVPLGSWSHVVGVFNGANVLLYTNLTPTTGNATAGPIDSHVAASLLVGDNAGSNGCFNGLTGEVRVYNRALSLAEITRNYQATKWKYQ